jgi:hypothetical protein
MAERTPSPPDHHPQSWYIEPDDDVCLPPFAPFFVCSQSQLGTDENQREESILRYVHMLHPHDLTVVQFCIAG